MSMRILLPALALATLLSACGRDWVAENPSRCVFDRECLEGYRCINARCVRIEFENPDGGPSGKEFGERCLANEECLSTYCLSHPRGAFCTRPCGDGCPAGFVCQAVPDPHGGPDAVLLCAPEENRLCRPCLENIQCGMGGADLCLSFPEGRFCARDCSAAECPAGYACLDVRVLGREFRQCLPAGGTCVCDEDNAGLTRGCSKNNEFGECFGVETCSPPDGFAGCSAADPAAENCNGLDDDCDGFADEGLEPAPCQAQNEFGACAGTRACRGFDGWRCDAPTPAPESCNGVDDDCDGRTDEDFRDAEGRYDRLEHCGGCGRDCRQLLPHASAGECRRVGEAFACRVLSCESGFFRAEDDSACLPLPDTLCQPCQRDADCLAPGSLCLAVDGERFCGRDCSAASPYPPGCPAGYLCQNVGSALQCQPQTRTCLCGAATEGAIRSCRFSTCEGYQVCRRDAGGFAWSACDVNSYNPEICDGRDNNCDGRTDEGFRNPVTGRYESPEHCGSCNNDCSGYFVPELDHTTGVCDLSSDPPRCGMGPCLTENVGGIDYEWVDTDADPTNGCECRRRLGNTDTDDPDLIGEPAPGLAYLDENCDGIDGVIARALFVRAGVAGGDGSRNRPFGTLAQALAAFGASGKSYILVAEGTYEETVALAAGVRLHGGYSADFSARDVALYPSIVQAPAGGPALMAFGIQSEALFSGFVVRGRDRMPAPAGQDGAPSLAIRIENCGPALAIRSNVVQAGRGGDGGAGAAGAAGFGRQNSAELDGGAGLDGLRGYAPCPAGRQRAGGRAGSNPSCPISSGQPGGTTQCPVYDYPRRQGAQAQYQSAAFGNGLGGYDWSFDPRSGSSCSHATESGYPDAIQLNVGQDGHNGADGAPGAGGTGGLGAWGSFAAGAWIPAPARAAAGADGGAGTGGGGGGGGGGTAAFNPGPGNCRMYEIGPSAGGGGAGGCGGAGGRAGGAGGASIGILILSSVPGSIPPSLSHNRIERGQGGDGGPGGLGGSGGMGGRGGFGGGPPDWISSQGGKGGDGGNGGPGGGGGGGAGGPSLGILLYNTSPGALAADNRFVPDESLPTGGAGGPGGVSVGANATGLAGTRGGSRNLAEFSDCSSTGVCPSGASCDGNGVCVPAP